jgi:hypothetical protein
MPKHLIGDYAAIPLTRLKQAKQTRKPSRRICARPGLGGKKLGEKNWGKREYGKMEIWEQSGWSGLWDMSEAPHQRRERGEATERLTLQCRGHDGPMLASWCRSAESAEE